MKFKKISDFVWEIPRAGNMNVPGRIYASHKMLSHIQADKAPEQVANVATLPGIIGFSMAMPDMHWGYGFSIGGVAAFDTDDGVISPGGVGYDINCGVRLLRTGLEYDRIRHDIQKLVDGLFRAIPTGVGSKGPLRVSEKDMAHVMQQGARWAVNQGMGEDRDLEYIEEHGEMAGAQPELVSEKAIIRGKPQLGTLGSGNHFVELQLIDEIFDEPAAQRLGLKKGNIAVTIHTGSRGLGYQVCDDSIKKMLRASEKYGIDLPDRQLCCAPIQSPEGQEYFGAMVAAINYAFANRQVITHWARESIMKTLRISPRELHMDVVYEVAHNIAKYETHIVDGQKKRVCVHRKGATRAFGPGQPELPAAYRDIGQPVLIPGDMGRASYVLLGTDEAMEQTFGSTCHGAGRLLSRNQAIKNARGRSIQHELAKDGIIVRATGRGTLAEEMPEAYKDVADVVDAVAGAGISRKVARLRPLGVIKG
ncbi:RtcB family protein [candidate division KSB1 bacterium]|nr:RtcB family protein [candidate division KSB1 bacterium]